MELLPKALQDAAVLRRIVFAAAYLPTDFPHYWSVVAEFASKACQSTQSLQPGMVKIAVENLRFINERAFATDKLLAQEIHAFVSVPTGCTQLGIVLVSPNSTCKLCNSKLLIRKERTSHVTIYTEMYGTVVGTHYHKYCQNFRKGCSFRQYYGYSSEGNQSVHFYDSNWAVHKYFVSSSETAFELDMLRKFDVELLIGQVSYNQKAEIYNYCNGYPVPPKRCSTIEEADIPPLRTESTESLHQRIRLDRRRLESAHLKFAVLTTQSNYPSMAVDPIPMYTDFSKTLAEFTLIFYEAFSERYSEHRCEFPGCKNVLVLDGNLKNQREICLAKDAGYISYPGLPGRIKTGCMASPAFKSRFCTSHKVRSCVMSKSGEELSESPQEASSSSGAVNAVVETILAMKETRGHKYYQVLWLGKEDVKVTWEPASSLPPTVVSEFHRGVVCNAMEEKSEQYGQEAFTFLVETNDLVSQNQKKPRRDRPMLKNNEGAFDESGGDSLTCNTEKDRHIRLNLRTAGILAGMRPCGVIVLLSELFTAESKTQVYGCLHNFYARHPRISAEIEFVCYDDACHLKKFARNPVRANITKHAIQLASVEMAVDKMHMRGHIDPWCKANCDPAKFPALTKVDTEVCEQVFAWLSKYSHMTRQMTQQTFMFFILHLCDMHNIREEKKLLRAGFMT